MNLVLACRVCLVTDIKMFRMDETLLAGAYYELTGVMVNNTPEYICYVCTSLLLKCREFRNKCIRANSIISNILNKNHKITKDFIKSIDRKLHNLESSIAISHTKGLLINYQSEDVLECIPIVAKDDDKDIVTVKVEHNVDEQGYQEFDVKNDYNEYVNNATDSHEDLVNHITDDISSDDDYLLKDYVLRKRKKLIDKPKREKKQRGRPKKKLQENDVKNEDYSATAENSINNEKTKKRTRKSKDNAIKKANIIKQVRKSGPKFDASYYDEYATVVLLTPEDARQEILLRKESSNYKNCRFKCELCYKGFEAQSTYENHMKRHSPESGEYVCDICHLRFPGQQFLYKHQHSCHKRKFSCKICSYVCFCASQAKIHISLHKGKKYPCEECGEVFSMPNSLLMHKRVKHPTECVCPLCGSTFATTRGLHAHHMLLHRQESNEKKGPLCEECNVHFASDTAWKRHLVLSSKHDTSNGCVHCGATFAGASALRTHVRREHARTQTQRADRLRLPAACTLCEKWLTKRSEYREHMKSAHPQSNATRLINAQDQRQCVCEVCGKMFKNPCFLSYHQRLHTGERPYACTSCGKTYACPGALATHRAAHLPARRHRCHLCARAYTFRSALNKHLKAHLGIRPHKCKICDKSFPNLCDVKQHTQYVHHKVPWPKRDRSKRTNATREEATNDNFLYTS